MATHEPSPRAGFDGSRPSTATSSAARRPSDSPLRQRPLARASTFADLAHPSSSLRRSSFLTNNSSTQSLDRASLLSSTENLLRPRASRSGTQSQNHESSHLESAPLVLALLPAVGGMVWTGASPVLTDVTLLVLASVFLNWSVRLPWDWYHTAQALRLTDDDDNGKEMDERNATTIIEEESLPIYGQEETGDRDGESSDRPRSPSSPSSPSISQDTHTSRKTTVNPHVRSASAELRVHELLALSLCFVSPILGVALLHTIRSQLSRPSEGLVSDYNLSIFLLAAELRPISHMLKMVQSRTLHLQKLVSGEEYAESLGITSSANPNQLRDLLARFEELEAVVTDRLSEHGASDHAQTDEVTLTRIARRAVQPDLDALTRATRRYEKKATLLGLQTSARLNELDTQLKDALTLAAGAERAASRRGLFATLADGLLWCLGLPGRVASAALNWVLGLFWEVWRLLIGTVGRKRTLMGRATARGQQSTKTLDSKLERRGKRTTRLEE
jgi:hypothetical protein